MACFIFYFKNKAPSPMTSFTTTLDLDDSEKQNLGWDVKSMADATLAQGAQSKLVVMFEAKLAALDKPPTMRVSYLAGALQAVTLKLPVALHKFMDPTDLATDDFFKRWKQIGGPPREAQQIFACGNPKRAREMTVDFIRATVEGFRWKLLDGVDSNQKNFVGASVLHTSAAGKFGCLMRLEPNFATSVSCAAGRYFFPGGYTPRPPFLLGAAAPRPPLRPS
jgi:AP-2 complex subunit alpha